jgi:hypothetical protein
MVEQYYNLFQLKNDDEIIKGFLSLHINDPVIMHYQDLVKENTKI